MEYKNELSNNNATTESHSSELDLTLRMGQPINIVNQQEEPRVQADDAYVGQNRRTNVGQVNYVHQGNLNYVNQGNLNYVNQTHYNLNYVNQGSLNYMNRTHFNYVNHQPWMTFASSMAPARNMFATTRGMPYNPTQTFGHFPLRFYQPKMEIQEKTCKGCRTTTTPMWRKGPDGPQTLCNACGLRYARLTKKED